MKTAKPSVPGKKGASGTEAPAGDEKAKSADLGIIERRQFIRPLPTPHVRESDSDTDWAAFQALISDNSKD